MDEVFEDGVVREVPSKVVQLGRGGAFSEECASYLFVRFFGPFPVGLNCLCSMQIVRWFPCVIAVWVASPFDQVLELPPASIVSVVCDGFHFIFFHAPY